MDDQVLELVAVDLGFLFVGEIAVLQPPAVMLSATRSATA